MKRKGFAQCKRILAGTVAAFMLTGVCPFNVLAMPAAEPSGYVMPAPAQDLFHRVSSFVLVVSLDQPFTEPTITPFSKYFCRNG